MIYRFFVAVLVMAVLSFCAVARAETFDKLSETQAFINDMHKKHGFDKKQLQDWFARYEPSEDVLTKIKKPFEGVIWGKYKNYLVTDERVQKGAEFWRENKALLAAAEKKYGVPAEIIVAILGIETYYGQRQGQYPVFQSLATLAFQYPPRAAFFKKELEEFLLLTRAQKLDPHAIKGSYAGAMGAPQFIASSYRRYAVDFTHVGTIDLMNHMPTAVGSVANYFKVHGWEVGQPVVHRAHLRGRNTLPVKPAKLSAPKPMYSISMLTKQGLVPEESGLKQSTAKVALLALDNGQMKEYWLGRENFYVITRYNHSSNYAMAVYELSQRIKKAHFAQS